MKSVRHAALAVLLAGAAGCELTEVTTAPGEDVLVVEAVLRTDIPTQSVLLHRSLQGRAAAEVPGATVVVTEPDGTEHTFIRGDDCYRIDRRYLENDSIDFRGTCYQSSPFEGTGWVRSGATYDLRVETPQGEVVRGRTTVPGAFALRRLPSTPRDEDAASMPVCSLRPGTALPVAWRMSEGAWSYVAQLRITGLRRALEPQGIDAPEPLELRGLAVSEGDTAIVLPTEFGVFERFQYDQDLMLAIRDGFPEGVNMELVVAAADRNWVNSVRGGSFNPSGPVRISTVVGDGVGVFGALVPLRVIITVRENTSIPRCGTFFP